LLVPRPGSSNELAPAADTVVVMEGADLMAVVMMVVAQAHDYGGAGGTAGQKSKGKGGDNEGFHGVFSIR
jgi:hypothetical protein